VGRLHWFALRLLSKSPLPDVGLNRGALLRRTPNPLPLNRPACSQLAGKTPARLRPTSAAQCGELGAPRIATAAWRMGAYDAPGCGTATPLRASSRTQSDRLSPGSKTNIEAYVVKDDDICQRRSRTVVKIRCAACKSTENGTFHFSDIGPLSSIRAGRRKATASARPRSIRSSQISRWGALAYVGLGRARNIESSRTAYETFLSLVEGRRPRHPHRKGSQSRVREAEVTYHKLESLPCLTPCRTRTLDFGAAHLLGRLDFHKDHNILY
jgi:hypothetical protein